MTKIVNILCQLNKGNLELPPDFVRILLGGEWPKSQDYGYPPGFAWNAIEIFILEHGELVPYAGGLPVDGPNLKLDTIPNPLTRISADNADI